MTLASEDERVSSAAAAGIAGEGEGRSADFRCFVCLFVLVTKFQLQLSC